MFCISITYVQIEEEYANRVKARVMLDAATVMSPRRSYVDDSVHAPQFASPSTITQSKERTKWEEEKTMRDNIVREMRVEIETVRREVELVEQQVSAKLYIPTV